MASNEIIVRIVVDCAAFTIGFITTILAYKLALARSAAAHNREIAELRERIKIAEDALTELQTRLVSSVYDGTMNPYEALEITERAIAAISEKGGAK